MLTAGNWLVTLGLPALDDAGTLEAELVRRGGWLRGKPLTGVGLEVAAGEPAEALLLALASFEAARVAAGIPAMAVAEVEVARVPRQGGHGPDNRLSPGPDPIKVAEALGLVRPGAPQSLEGYGLGTLDLVGIAEVAEMLDVTRQRASKLVRTPAFPAMVASPAAGPLWLRAAVVRFASQWRRQAGKSQTYPMTTLAELAQRGALDEDLAEVLAAAVRARETILVTGPLRSGRTTLLRALALEIPEPASVAAFEWTPELGLHTSERSGVHYYRFSREGSDVVTNVAEFLAAARRFGISRLVVDDTEPEELVELLGDLSFLPGSLVSLASQRAICGGHAEVIPRPGVAEAIAESVGLILHLAGEGKPGRPTVASLSEVCGLEGAKLATRALWAPGPGGRAHIAGPPGARLRLALVEAGLDPRRLRPSAERLDAEVDCAEPDASAARIVELLRRFGPKTVQRSEAALARAFTAAIGCVAQARTLGAVEVEADAATLAYWLLGGGDHERAAAVRAMVPAMSGVGVRARDGARELLARIVSDDLAAVGPADSQGAP